MVENNSLLNFETQEAYFAKIVERYHQIESPTFAGNDLNNAFTSLSIDANSTHHTEIEKPALKITRNRDSRNQQANSASNELSTLLMAMRKLREAIVASSRIDNFTLQAYTFIIRTSILFQHMQSYHPALLYLLRRIHPVFPLTESDYHEFLGYYILDLACRQGDLATAFQVKCQSNYSNARVEALLKALVHGDWYVFWMLEAVMTAHQKSLLEQAEDRIRTHALKCLGRSYLSVDRQHLEETVHCSWKEVVEKNDLGWQLDGDIITIRRIKK